MRQRRPLMKFYPTNNEPLFMRASSTLLARCRLKGSLSRNPVPEERNVQILSCRTQ